MTPGAAQESTHDGTPDSAPDGAHDETQDDALTRPTAAVGDSVTVAAWTLVSRVSGFGRVAVTAGVLGPTFLGNTYQATNQLPNIIYYGLLAGSLVSSLLVPALVGHIDAGDRRAAERVAGGALGLAMIGAAVVVPLAVLVAPAVLALGTLGSAAAAVGPAQERLAALFLLLLGPQVVLYAVVACSVAVQNAHRRFALAAAAPAVENLGAVTVLVVTGVAFPFTASPVIPGGELLLLGGGTTVAVALHAAVQWWGARRAGVTLRPAAGWRDPETRALARRALPALAQASLDAVALIAVLVVANRIAGGVVAYQLGANFFFLVIALGATPVALSLLPRLARLESHPDPGAFRDVAVRGLRFAMFLAVPAAVVLLVLAPVLATAASFGRMATDGGHTLLALVLPALAPGVVGETAFLVGTYASYARGETSAPLRSMVIKAGVCLLGLAVALTVAGPRTIAVVGLAVSVAALVAAAHRVRALLRGLPRGRERLAGPLLRTVLAGAVAAVPLAVAARVLDGTGQAVALAGAVGACVVAGAVYLGVQSLLRGPEVAWLLGVRRER